MTELTFILQAAYHSQPTVTIWAIIASIAAVISAASAFKSSAYAKKVYALAEKNYNDRQANFSLYLIESYRWKSNELKKELLLFQVTISNKSDNKSSYKGDLEIEYIRTDESVARAIIPHDESLQNLIPLKGLSAFSNDIRIEEKGMQSKWLIFEEPINVLRKHKIEKYCIKISDTHGNVETANSIIIKELRHD